MITIGIPVHAVQHQDKLTRNFGVRYLQHNPTEFTTRSVRATSRWS